MYQTFTVFEDAWGGSWTHGVDVNIKLECVCYGDGSCDWEEVYVQTGPEPYAWSLFDGPMDDQDEADLTALAKRHCSCDEAPKFKGLRRL